MIRNLFKHCDTNKPWADKTVEYLIYLSVVLIPLVFLPNISSVFSFPKLYIFRVITLIIIFIWGFRLLLNKSVCIKWAPVLWFLVGYAFVSILNTIFTVNIFTSLFGNYGYFIGIFTVLNLFIWSYIVMVEMNTSEKIQKLLWCSVITAFVISIYGIFQHQDWFVNVLQWSQDPRDRVFSTIGHSNHTAAYLGMNIMLIIGLIRNSEFGWKKIGLWAMGVLMIVAIVMTASRGGILALLIGIICWLIYGFSKKHFVSEIKKYMRIILVVIVLLFVSIVTFRDQVAQFDVVQRTYDTFDFIGKGNIPDRVSWWLSSLEMIKDKPILGSGLSTFRDVYNQYRRADYRLPDDMQDTITPEAAHMEYFNIWATQGTLGFLVYLAMIISVFVYARKLIKKTEDGQRRVVIFSLVTAMIVYLVEVVFSFGVIATLFILYTFIGLIFAHGLSGITGISNMPGKLDITKISNITRKLDIGRIPGAFRWLCALAAATILAFGLYFSILQLLGEYHFKQGDSYSSQRMYPQAIQSYEKSINFVPYHNEYVEQYADFLFNLGITMPDSEQPSYLKDTILLYEKALKINSNFPSVHVNYALAASRLADLSRDNPEVFEKYKALALNQMKIATEISKNNPLYPYKYGEMLMFFGDNESALEQFNNVLKIRDPYKDTKELIEQNI